MLANPLALDGIKGGFAGIGGWCSGSIGVNGAVALNAGKFGIGARAGERAGAAGGIEAPGAGCGGD